MGWFGDLGRALVSPVGMVGGLLTGGIGGAVGASAISATGDSLARQRTNALRGNLPDISGAPEFQSALDANGNLQSKYQLGSGPYQESPWASMMKQQAGLQRQIGADNLAQSGAANAAQARSTLAMRGGLAQGGTERIATAMGREQMFGQQNLARDNMLANLNIGAQDWKNQQSNQQFNIQNSLGALQGQNGYNMDLWKIKMQQQAANALAMNEAGQKPGIFGLGAFGL